MQIIIYLAISQSLFSAILILTKKDGGIPDKLLSTWLIFMAIELCTCLIDIFFFTNTLISSVFLLLNPAFYLYIKSLTRRDFKLKYIQLLHLIPYITFEIITYVVQQPFNINFLESDNPHIWFSLSFSIVNIISWIFYNITSISLVHKHRINLKNEFSNIEPAAKIAWILFVLIFYFIYCSFAVVTGILALNFDYLMMLPSVYNFSVMLGLAYILGFYGLRQEQLFKANGISKLEKATFQGKYKSSVLTEKDKNKIREMIINYFESQQPYLNPNFNLSSLSKFLKIPKHHLTEVLNTHIGRNFFSFVNEYRIEAVKKMLADQTLPYSIEAIGYDCGFNSKSSFYTVFKSVTGLTPLQYKNQRKLHKN